MPLTLADLHLSGARLRDLRERSGRHRTDNRTGHYTLDSVTRPLSQLVEQDRSWAGSVR